MTADRCSAEPPADRERWAYRADRADRAVLAEARAWLGTPYRHQASARGAGADCLGLVRGVWRAVVGPEPELPGPYSADWAEMVDGEALLRAALRHLRPVAMAEARGGDVLLFRMRARGPAKHLAILSSHMLAGGTIIHAYSGHAVCETHLSAPWARRLVAAFRFPSRSR